MTPLPSSLSYTKDTRGAAPIPAAERDLPTALAEPFTRVSERPMPIEGLSTERDGALVFSDIVGGRLLRLARDGTVSTVHAAIGATPSGTAVHRDGRIFVTCLGPRDAAGAFNSGSVVAVDPDGGARAVIAGEGAGLVLNDIVFDQAGGIYVTDLAGSSTDPVGGVYYVAAGTSAPAPVMVGMSGANGIALAPDGKAVWAVEYRKCRLHRADVTGPGTVAPFSTSTPFQTVGRAPDTVRTDADGNVYVALMHQGRVLVLSPNGIPIGQILLPGRDEGRFLKSTSLALTPASREVLIGAWDDDGGTVIFRAEGLAPGAPLFAHR